jgi:hypothetical protein
MRNKQPDSDELKGKPPFNDFDLGLNATHLISDTPRSKKASFIEKIELKPTDQRRILLGNFTENNPPKGFSVEITPDPNPEGSVLTEVTSLGTSKRYKLVMHITNYGISTVSAEVWIL